MKYTPVTIDIIMHLIQIYYVDEYTSKLLMSTLAKRFSYIFKNLESYIINMKPVEDLKH